MAETENFTPAVRGAHDICCTEYPPVEFLVPSLIPKSGLVLFAGASKVGKSWWILQLLLSLCTGQEFLGQPLTGEHTVLYLALEDSEARIKNRIGKMQIAETNNLRIATRWWHNAEGVSKLKTYISAHSETDLIAIDTKGVFGTGRTEESFQSDYDWMCGLKQLADEFRIAVILITHTRKLPPAEDEYESISGSTANMAAADTILLLKRRRQTFEGILYCTGRDFPEQTLPIMFDAETCTWHKADHVVQEVRTPERQRVVDIFRESGREMSPAEIAVLYGGTSKNVSNLLNQMYRESIVDHGSKRGYWKLAGKSSESFLSCAATEPYPDTEIMEA
jgi:hypothetical protein